MPERPPSAPARPPSPDDARHSTGAKPADWHKVLEHEVPPEKLELAIRYARLLYTYIDGGQKSAIRQLLSFETSGVSQEEKERQLGDTITAFREESLELFRKSLGLSRKGFGRLYETVQAIASVKEEGVAVRKRLGFDD